METSLSNQACCAIWQSRPKSLTTNCSEGASMAVTNRQRVDQALELLNRGLLPYVEREMKPVYGAAKWEKQAILALGDRPLLKPGNWDTPALLSVMIGEWQNVFKR